MGEQSSAGFSPVESLVAQRDTFLRFVLKRVNDEAAEDILQGAYARAVVHADSLRDEEAADAWFYRILRNAIVDFYRHRSVVNRFVEMIEEGAEPVSFKSDDANICPCLAGVIDEMRPAYSAVLREVDLAEESEGALAGFARRSGIAVGTAAVRSHRARKALEKRLRDTCGSCAGAGCLNCSCKPGK